jgi:hypothetical protein
MLTAAKLSAKTTDVHSTAIMLSDEQRQILAFCQKQLKCTDKKASFRLFRFADALSESYTVALTSIENSTGLHYVFICLPTASNKTFVMLSDTFRPELAELTAYCCSQSESNDAVGSGYTAELPSLGWDSLKLNHWQGLMITALDEGFETAISEVRIGSENFEICLILLLNKNEYKTAKKTNTEEQMTFFHANKRPLFQFKLFANNMDSEQFGIAEKKKPLRFHRGH